MKLYGIKQKKKWGLINGGKNVTHGKRIASSFSKVKRVDELKVPMGRNSRRPVRLYHI